MFPGWDKKRRSVSVPVKNAKKIGDEPSKLDSIIPIKKKRIKRKKTDDVENVLSLRRHFFQITFGFDKFTFEQLFRQKWHHGVFVVFIVAAIFTIFIGSNSKANIAKVDLYPKSCLGGWQNPHNAEGEPNVSKKGTNFTTSNSAVVSNSSGEIFCGDFSGEIPEEAVPKKFTVKFSWLITDHLLPEKKDDFQSIDKVIEISPDATTPDIRPEDASNVIPEPKNENAPLETERDIEKEPSQKTDMLPEDLPASGGEVTPQVDAPVPESSPSFSEPTVKFWNRFIPEVHAQEEIMPAPVEVPTKIEVVPIQESVFETPTDIVTENISTEEVIPETIPNINVPSSVEEMRGGSSGRSTAEVESIIPENDFLEVVYTLDGTSWKTLGKINSSNWKDAAFLISDPQILQWQDLSKIQISLRTIPTIDAQPTIYLDSMYIEVEYEKAPEQGDAPKVSIREGEVDLVGSSLAFGSDQAPTFIVTDPELSIPKLRELIAEDKAEILEDKDGILEGKVIIDGEEILPTYGEFFDTNSNTIKEATIPKKNKIIDSIRSLIDPVVNDIESGTQISNPAPSIKVEPDDIFPTTIPEKKGVIELTPTPEVVPKTESDPQDAAPVEEIGGVISADSPTVKSFNTSNMFSLLKPEIAHAENQSHVLHAEVLNHLGELTDIETNITIVTIDGLLKEQVTVDKPAVEFKPGKYSLKITLQTQTAIIDTTQDFTWGVLVVNPDKSIYAPGDDAFLSFGVLNDEGHTICGADLDMDIITPLGSVHHFTTDDESIMRDVQCGPDNVIEVPDYYAHFLATTETGEYLMTLTATTANGTKTITDKFDVDPATPFDVRRVTASRIYPGANYPVTIYITAKQDFIGTLEERVPESFGVLPPQNSIGYDSVVIHDGQKIISWNNIQLTAGEEKVIGYYYDAPSISPEVFLLGPLKFNQNGTNIFQESRRWQIASDGVNKYWVGGTGTWNQTDTTHWATSSGGAGGTAVPGATDNVFFDGNSGGGTVTVATATALAQDVDFTGFTGTWAGSTASTISGSLTLGSANVNPTYTGAITFNATSGTKTITLNGKTLSSNIIFNGVGGTWQLADTFLTSGGITLTNGTWDINSKTTTFAGIDGSNTNVRGLLLGSATITNSGQWQIGTTTNLTFSPGTSSITMTNSAGAFFGGGMTYYDVSLTSAGTHSIAGINTFHNFTRTATASKTCALGLTASQTVTNMLTLSGNSVTNRLLVQSNTVGTPFTLTAANTAITYVDFTDVTAAGAASPFTGTSMGNALGNTNITFDTPVTRYAKAATSKSWSDTTMWSATSGGATGATVPLPQDTVVFDASSITAGSVTITADMPRMGAGISFTGVTNTPTLSFGSTGNTVFGSFTFVSGMNISGTNVTIFRARSSVTLTTAGKTLTQGITVTTFGGTLTLQDDLTSNGIITLTNGTLDTNSKNITSSSFDSSNTTVRALTMGTTTWTLTGTATVWSLTTITNMTFTKGTSTIKITATSATARTFAGGSLNYYNFWSSAGASTASLTISGDNTFNDFKDSGTAAHSILFTVGSTQTVNTFTVSGTSGNVITINSTTTGVHYLNKAGGGYVDRDYLNIQHSIAGPATTWYAGTNSTNNQATATAGSGWTFTAAPGTVCTATATGTMGGTDTANFTNCSGAASGGSGTGLRPGAGDHLTVNSGVTITLGANTAALGVITLDGSFDTASGSNYSISATNININSTGTLTANASTITLNGTAGTLFYKHSSGTFTYGTSTVVANGDGAVTLTGDYATSFYNLTFSPTLSAARSWIFGNGAVTVNGNFDSNPSGGGSARALTTTLGVGGLTVVGTFTLQGTSSGTTTIDTSLTYNAPLTFTTVNITSGDTLTPRGSAINITGTSGTLITNSGTWTNAVASSVTTLSGNGSATVNTAALSFYELVITGTGTKTLASTVTVSRILTISAGTLSLGSGTLSLTGTTGVPFPAPVGTFSAGTGTVSYGGNFVSGNTTIQTTGVTYYSLTLNSSVEVFTPNGTITGDPAGTLAVTAGTLDTTSSNYAITFGKISIASAATSIMTANASTVSLTATSGTLFTRGASGVFTQGTSDVKVTSASGTGITLLSAATTFHKLTIDTAASVINAGAVITMSSTDAANKLYIKTGVLNDGGNTIVGTANGTLVVDGGASLCISGTAAGTSATCNSGAVPTSASTFPTNYTNGNITLAATSTVAYLADAAQTISSTPTYGNLKLTPLFVTTARTYTAADALTINGDFTITPDESGAGTPALTVNPAGDISVASGKTTTISKANSASSSLDMRPASTDYNLSTGLLVVATGGTLDAASTTSTITLTGTSGTLFTKAGTYTQGTSEVVVASASGTPTLLSAATTFHRLKINSTATVINAGAVITMSNTDAANRLYIQAGVLNDGGNTIAGTSNGTLVLDSGTTLCISGTPAGTTATCNSGAVPTTASTFPSGYTNGNITLHTASTVIYLADAAQTISSTPTYGNLKLTPLFVTTSRTYTAGGALTINGNFTITPDESGAGTPALSVNPAGTITVATAKTTTISAANSATATLDLRPASTDYNISTGNMAIGSGGTLDAASAASTITLTGNWSNAGTFTAGSSAVVLSGSSTQTLSGTMISSSAFYDLTLSNSSGTDASDCERTDFVASVDFDAAATVTHNYTITTASVRVEYNSGSTYTIANLNWNGQASGTRIFFRNSAVTGTWLLNVSGTQTSVQYINVSRSDASGGNGVVVGTGYVDCNNNTNWVTAASITFTLSDTSIGFGTLSASAARYATGDTTGSSSEVEAHNFAVTTSSAGGYVASVFGPTLTRVGGAQTIAAIGGINTASSPGTAQFGLRLTATGGSGTVTVPYAASGFAYDGVSAPSQVGGASSGDNVTTTYSVRYLGNISSATTEGAYSTNATYVVTGTF